MASIGWKLQKDIRGKLRGVVLILVCFMSCKLHLNKKYKNKAVLMKESNFNTYLGLLVGKLVIYREERFQDSLETKFPRCSSAFIKDTAFLWTLHTNALIL